MTNRRDFLKQSGVLGAAAMFSRTMTSTNFADDTSTKLADLNESFTVQMGEIVKNILPRRGITIPDVEGFQVLKGDFHIHTIFSDGNAWPHERVSEAVNNGLDVIAITDHIEYRPHVGGNGLKLKDRNDDHNISYQYAKDTAKDQGLLLVQGTEITKSKMPPGHFNALFVQDVNPIAAVQDDYRKMFEEVIKQGGFLHWNHPGWEAPKSGGIEKGAPTVFTEEHEDIYKNGWMHGIEAFNHYEFYPIVSNWCERKDLAIFANSDIHGMEVDVYGLRNPRRPVNLIFAKEKTLESVKEAFFAKRTVAWVADKIIGREKWVKPLFKACVEIQAQGDKISLKNRSSIFAAIQCGDQSVNLAPLGTAELKRKPSVETLTISNWQIGMDKPLEISIDA